jgi:putative sterol carrier protein
MSVADIEAALSGRLAQFSELGAKLKFDFGDDRLFIDGTQTPAVMSHDDEDADCTLVVSPDDLTKIMHGQLDATMAFMTGKLKVKGNTGIAMKLASVLK